jgi:nitrite reductase (NADH) small subunit
MVDRLLFRVTWAKPNQRGRILIVRLKDKEPNAVPWTSIANMNDCPPGRGLEAVVGDQLLAIFNVDGQLFALDGVCPHQGGPLADGELTGCIVTCPWHGWQFDVRTGQHQLNRAFQQPRFEAKIEDGQIWVNLLDVETTP